MTPRGLSLDALVAALAGERPPALLDVRELGESEHAHIPGAAILPRRRIEFRIDALARDRATPLVTVDSGDDLDPGRRDPRAALAADTLAGFGYDAVASLDGGLAAWRAGGLPLVSGSQVSAQAFGRRVGDLAAVASVDVDTLRAWQVSGRRVALCDVRTAGEHTEGCIPGAVSLPGFEVVSHALDMAAEADVIVLCSSARTRSLIVARTLIDLGPSDVVAVDGGTLAWSLAGHELERGSRRRRVQPSSAARQFAALGAARLAKHFGVQRLEAADLALLLQSTHGNFGVFDLRNLGHHGVAHVPRSVSVASDALIVRHAELLAASDAPAVLVDDDEVRALLTGVWLRRLGVAQVAKLAGGYASWAATGRLASIVADTPLGWHAAVAATPGLGAEDVARWLADGAPAALLHVDTGGSWRRGHLPGARWLPRGWLEARIDGVLPTPASPVLLSCTDGTQAAFAAATLRRRGFTRVAWLQGGTRLWRASGRVLEVSSQAPLDDELLLPSHLAPHAMRAYLGQA